MIYLERLRERHGAWVSKGALNSPHLGLGSARPGKRGAAKAYFSALKPKRVVWALIGATLPWDAGLQKALPGVPGRKSLVAHPGLVPHPFGSTTQIWKALRNRQHAPTRVNSAGERVSIREKVALTERAEGQALCSGPEGPIPLSPFSTEEGTPRGWIRGRNPQGVDNPALAGLGAGSQ